VNQYQTITDNSVIRFLERLDEADATMEVVGYSICQTKNDHTLYSALLRRRDTGRKSDERR
jgi:hypothetical protein